MIAPPLLAQAEQTLAQLYKRKEELDVRANRMINELSWRLFPTGGAANIDQPPTRQAFEDLMLALNEWHELERKLKEFPDLLRKEVA